ncbi:hypothetical protein ACX3V1_20910 [Escherichia coli]
MNCYSADPPSAQCRRQWIACLLYTSPSPRDISGSRLPSSACDAPQHFEIFIRHLILI